jgi:hypothetical protein
VTQTLPTTTKHKRDRVPTYIGANQSPDGNERQERACQSCGLIKITVIPPKMPPFPWRRWRWPGLLEFAADQTPTCTGHGAQSAQLREAG